MPIDIQSLSVAEHIQLVEDIWDTIAAEPDALDFTEAQRQELDHRLSAMQQNSQEGILWPDLKAKLTKQQARTFQSYERSADTYPSAQG